MTTDPVALAAVASELLLDTIFSGVFHAFVPTAVSFAPVPALLICSPGASLGEIEDEGLVDAEGDTDGDTDAEGETEGDTDGDTDEEPAAARGKAAITPTPIRATAVDQAPRSSVTAEPASL